MKKLFILLFSIFLLSSPSVFADNISDFDIGEISIGDSLLDYMTEEEILEEIEANKYMYTNLKEPNKYAEVYLFKNFHAYSYVKFFIKNNTINKYVGNKNEKYTILRVAGSIDYIEDLDSCIAKRNEIVVILSKMFPNARKRELIFPNTFDPSGNSIMDDISFFLDSGKIRANCSNWDETFRIKHNYSEGLSVAIQSKEITEWLINKN